MKKLITIAILSMSLLPVMAQAKEETKTDPAADREAFRGFFAKHLGSDIKLDDLKDGVYALDEDARSQWVEIEDFPPYEIETDKGEELWNKRCWRMQRRLKAKRKRK